MLEHTRDAFGRPIRVVILGAGGFVGSAAVERLRQDHIAVSALARTELDLLGAGSSARLGSLLDPTDALLVIAARAPCKTPSMLEENIRMMRAVCDALAKQP